MKQCTPCKNAPVRPHKVTIQRKKTDVTPGADGSVNYALDANWETLGVRSASVRPRGGYERLGNDQVQAVQTHQVRMFCDSLTGRIIPEWRLLFKDRYRGELKLEVVASDITDKGWQEVVIDCVEAK